MNNMLICFTYAGVLELVDETDSKSVVRNGVWVRVPPPAPKVDLLELVKSIAINEFKEIQKEYH